MPKVSSVIQQYRLKYKPEEVLILDCGDHMDRTRIETEGTYGLANIEIMNQTGYEAVILGNNEGLTYTPAILSNLYEKNAGFPVIGSNIVEINTGKIPRWMVPYYIIRKGSLKIGIIGVTVNFNKFYELLGWHISDPLPVIEKILKELKPIVDVVIVMSHLGLSKDQEMAEKINGIDCIFGGHTHHLLEKPLNVNQTYICCAGKFGQYVGILELQYDDVSQKLIHGHGQCLPVSEYEDDPVTLDIIDKYQKISDKRLNITCAYLEKPLSMEWYKESELGNLLAAGIKSWTQADIGIVNAGQLLNGIEAGEVTFKQLLEICPAPINPCRMKLSGRSLLKALEESLLSEFYELPIRGFGFRGKVLGSLCMDGVVIDYDPSRTSNDKITQVLINGAPIQLEHEYLVGTIDMFTFGIGYNSFTEGSEVKYFLPEFIRDVLHKQLLDKDEIYRSKELRWITKS